MQLTRETMDEKCLSTLMGGAKVTITGHPPTIKTCILRDSWPREGGTTPSGKQNCGLQKVSQGFQMGSQGLQKVSQGLQVVSQGLQMVSQGLQMVSQGLQMVSWGSKW